MGNTKDKDALATAVDLRSRAEKLLKSRKPDSVFYQGDAEVLRLLHELQVHQIELEMQNVELLQARDKMESMLEKYTDLYDFAPVAYFTLDQVGSIRAANLTGARFLGIERSQLLGRRFNLFVVNEHRQLFCEFLGQMFVSQRKEFCEVMLLPDGESRLYVQIEAIVIGTGQECRVVVIDINERKQAEEEAHQLHKIVAQEKNLLSALMRSITDEIWFADSAGKFKLVNPSGSREFNLNIAGGIDVRELATSLEVLRTDGSPRPIEEAPPLRALRGEIVRNQEELIRTPATGELRYRQVSSAPVHDAMNNIIGSVSVVRDVTERMRIEEILRKNEKQLGLVLQANSMGTFEVNLQTGEEVWNDTEFELLGLKPGLAPGNPKLFFQYVHPNDIEALKAKWEDALRFGVLDAEFRIVRADGQERWLAGKGRFLYDTRDKSQAIRFLGINFDITERKQAEEQIRVSLAEKVAMLKEIHHRVKNNLQIISSLVSLQADNLTDGVIREEFDDVCDRINSMALIHEKLYQNNDLARLDFAEYSTSLLHYLWSSHDVLSEKVKLNLALVPLSLSIEIALPCGLILNELASNALKHAFPNGSDGEVTVGLEHDPGTNTAFLWVHDNGVGLPKNQDWRQSKSLGLHLVQILAGQLHGTVDMRWSSKSGHIAKQLFSEAAVSRTLWGLHIPSTNAVFCCCKTFRCSQRCPSSPRLLSYSLKRKLARFSNCQKSFPPRHCPNNYLSGSCC